MKKNRRIGLLLLPVLPFVLAGAVSADAWTNLARGQKVTGSYTADYLEEFGWIWENAVDGDRNGEPIALREENGTAWLQIDFEAATKMNRVLLIPFAQCYPVDFRIEVLVNGSWREGASLTGQKEPGMIRDAAGSTFRGQEIAFDTLEGTALRLTATRLKPDTNGDRFMQLREIEVYYDAAGDAVSVVPSAEDGLDWLIPILGGAGVLVLTGAGVCFFLILRGRKTN